MGGRTSKTRGTRGTRTFLIATFLIALRVTGISDMDVSVRISSTTPIIVSYAVVQGDVGLYERSSLDEPLSLLPNHWSLEGVVMMLHCVGKFGG